jgi:hypothetical protein
MYRRIADRTVEQIDKLLDDHTCVEIAEILNRQGLQTGPGMPFKADAVDRLIHGRRSAAVKRDYEIVDIRLVI